MVARELKVFAVFVNILMMLVGGALVAVGVYVSLDNHGMIKLSRINGDGEYSSTPGLLDVTSVLIIVCGCLSFLVALHGIFSLCREWRCMLALYMAGLIVILLLEAVTVALSVVFTYRVEDHLYNATLLGIRDQFEGHIVTKNEFSKAFDEAQVEFECCGLNNYTDFGRYSMSWHDKDSLQIPKTCCHMEKGSYFNNDQYVLVDLTCARLPTPVTAHIEEPCFTFIKDWLEEMAYFVMGMAIVGAGAELIAILVTVCLIRDVGSSKEPK